MKNFTVNVERTSTRFASFEINAESAQEAKYAALEQAGDHDFPSEKDAEYEATVIGDERQDGGVSIYEFFVAKLNESFGARPYARGYADGIECFAMSLSSRGVSDEVLKNALSDALNGCGNEEPDVDPSRPSPEELIEVLKEIQNAVSFEDEGDAFICAALEDEADPNSDRNVSVLLKAEKLIRRWDIAEIFPQVENEQAEIVKMLQASTAHLTEDEANALCANGSYVPGSDGYVHIANGEFEIFIRLSEDEEITGVSDGFKEVANYARERGIALIRFDRDALEVPGCTKYNW